MRIGFDNDKYIALQAEHIRNRINQFGGKLYLEFGGKLFDDYHAARVLPGFEPDSKIRMLKSLADEVEIIKTVYEDVRDHVVFERAYTPLDFAERFNAYDGATFGLRPTLGQSNYWRPHNKATDCSRLYFCGSSVHPGAGVPIVLLSAKLAAEELMRDDRL